MLVEGNPDTDMLNLLIKKQLPFTETEYLETFVFLIRNTQYKQKAVDILMAMDLMRVPVDYSKIKKIILMASDSDFVPIIQYVKKLGVEVILHTHYSKKRKSNRCKTKWLFES